MEYEYKTSTRKLYDCYMILMKISHMILMKAALSFIILQTNIGPNKFIKRNDVVQRSKMEIFILPDMIDIS